ncbi:retrotransposon Orf1 [Artemisia annua]|uniref:Retrotransposon Orf1 n=1 Tax=Artemisia annua TaxID=35608 RepID=A0A2U1NRT5_ARTAN|nr:retrotransposon Orf1 [Artemisia annua]
MGMGNCKSDVDALVIQFRLGRKVYRCLVAEFVWRVRLYSVEESHDLEFRVRLRHGMSMKSDMACLELWPTIMNGEFRTGYITAMSIRDPKVRLTHRCIGTSIVTRRDSMNRITMMDMFYLYTIYAPKTYCNIPFWLARMKSVRGEQNDTLESPTQTDKIDSNKVIIEDWVERDDKVVPEGFSKVKKKKNLKSVKFAEPLETKPVKSHKKSDKNPRKNNYSPRGNQRNWNGMITQKLGKNFEFQNKACYVCGSFDHLQYTCKHKKPVSDQKQVWNNSRRINHRNFSRDSKYPQQRRSFNPSAVLTKQGLKQLAKPKVTRSVLSQSTDRLSQSTARPKERTTRLKSEKREAARLLVISRIKSRFSLIKIKQFYNEAANDKKVYGN